MFGFIKEKFKKVYDNFTSKVSSLFTTGKLDQAFLDELSRLLLSADTGVKTTNSIIQKLQADIGSNKITSLEQAKDELEVLLQEQLTTKHVPDKQPHVLLMLGVNGTGKTTFISKYAHKLKRDGGKILVVAADTFRAAAPQQLQEWAARIGVEIFLGKQEQDPASVVFDACEKFKQENFSHIIIDTAGRLQTKINLMKELEKIKKIVQRQLPDHDVHTWLTIDAMLGQNSLAQAEVFGQATSVNGIVLTKLDGSGKGGIVFSIIDKLSIPIVYVTFGEGLEDIKPFDGQQYVHDLLHG
ncbi:MAG: signal recognition particle-docking protein FtsY [Epsilonproteobacteria bacterium]|nr:signal recognition particle-docking protein FtsY [Campylobacterota bacterium]